MSRPLLLMLAVTALITQAVAQTQIYIDHGANAGDKFAYSVRCIGDATGDEIPDFAMGSPFFDTPSGTNSGQVRIYSGADGSLVRSLDGFLSGDEFGYALDAAGDVDGDGLADIVITRLIASATFKGAAYVYSVDTGAIIHSILGTTAYDYFGVDCAGVGDVDADGYDDFAVGAPGNDAAGVAAGQLKVYSGKTGLTLHTINGTNAGDQLGWFVDRAGDINGDGYADFMVSSREHNGPNGAKSGRVQVFSGVDATVIYSFYGDAAGDQFGWTCSTAGDVNGDGTDDIIVGGHRHDVGANSDVGMARVFSGADGTTIYTWYGDAAGDLFGWAVRNAGDVDGDGRGDLMVGAHLSDSVATDAGLARIYSGATGAVLHSFYGQDAGDWCGYSLGSAGDLDRDGFDEVIIGSIYEDSGPAGTSCGTWRVYELGATGNPPMAWTRDAGCPGSDGNLPRISQSGRAAIGQSYTMHLRGALPSTPALLLFGGPDAVSLPSQAPGCTLHVTILAALSVTTDANGFASAIPISPSLPNNPSFVGFPLHHQWVVLDAAANAFGAVGSDAAVIQVGQ